MTDHTKAVEFAEEMFDLIEEAREALAKTFDKHEVDPKIGAIALATLLHQIKDEIDGDDTIFVEEMTSCCTQAVDIAKELDNVDQEVMH
tara:strand:+ start:1287 stop:1553 length:267 start_codon:yes stop_codon:yes gene_type:complete